PLERKLAELGKVLIAISLLLTVLVVGIGIYQGHPVYNMFLAGVSLAVAAIPEGLPAIVTVALSLGVQRMIRKNAIVRRLASVETLGCASVICSDKTGTMTENEMTVKEVFVNGKYLYVTGDGYDIRGNYFLNKQKVDRSFPHLESMLLYGMLCNHATLHVKRGKYYVDGDPTDGALLVAARKMGLSAMVSENYRIVKEFPFDSDRKRMSVGVEDENGMRFLITKVVTDVLLRRTTERMDENGMRFLITKGAPDVLLPRTTYRMGENGRTLLRESDQVMIRNAIDRMAGKALRTIAIGVKPLVKNDSLQAAFLERDLTFIGL